MEYEAHPAADLFPLLEGEAYESLKKNIAEHGLIQPIVLYDGKILDGRNRYRACRDAGIEPKFTEYTGDSPTAYAWQLNGERRHMTPGQLSAVATKMLPALQEEAKRRQVAAGEAYGRGKKKVETSGTQPIDDGSEGRATNEAAKIVGVSNSTVKRTNYVKKRDPELFAKIESGELTPTEAVKILKERERETGRGKTGSKAKHIENIQRLAGEGYRASQIAEEIGIDERTVRTYANSAGIELPDVRIGKTRRIDARRVIETMVHGLAGYAQGLQTINGGVREIDPSLAAEWADSLKGSLAPIQRLRKQLLEIANGN